MEFRFIFLDHYRMWLSVYYNSMMGTLPCIVPNHYYSYEFFLIDVWLLRLTIANLYENLSTGKESVFFDSVADDVHWTVMGTRPVAGV